MSRKAFIGLSTPIGYNYEFETATTKPNPILDSPWGLFLFYDEIWFLDRGLCPLNCQNLPYVHFLNEEFDLEKNEIITNYKEINNALKIDDRPSTEVRLSRNDIVNINLGDGYNLIDNHGRGIKIGNVGFSFNPTLDNLIIDNYIANNFGFELITNTYINQYLVNDIEPNLRAELTQSMLVDNIPNTQRPEGPYHPILDELRSERLLAYFRSKISEFTSDSSDVDVLELKSSLTEQMEIYKNDLVLKDQSIKRLFKATLAVTTSLFPIISNLYSGSSFIDDLNSFSNSRKSNGWVGFTVKAKTAISNMK